jgi:hypothetical protein
VDQHFEVVLTDAFVPSVKVKSPAKLYFVPVQPLLTT